MSGGDEPGPQLNGSNVLGFHQSGKQLKGIAAIVLHVQWHCAKRAKAYF